jgi:hypothetical protein
MTMNINFRRIFGTASAVAVLMGAGVLAVAAPASAQSARPWPGAVTPASVTPVFDLNGVYTDGGSARPRITDVNDTLTVDMSSQNRPTASGVVVSTTMILVVFPDEAPHWGTLVAATGRIIWDNGSRWQKLTTVTVPDVIGLPVNKAVPPLKAAGLTVQTQNGPVCGSQPKVVIKETPAAGTQAVAGSQVRITVSNC